VRDFGDPVSVGILTEELDLYLPEGRVAGGRAIFAFSNTSGSVSLVVAEGRFNADLSTATIDLMGVRSGTVEYSASFPAGNGAVVLAVRRNLETVSDIANFVRARLTLCPGGATPDPRLSGGAAMTPTSSLTLTPGTPFGAGTETIRLLEDGVAVPVTIGRRSGSLVLTPARALRPTAQLALDVGELRDAVGRPYVLAGQPRLLRTTATVVDWTFATPPPEGAIAGNFAPGVIDGALRTMFHYPQPFRAVIALGAPPAAAFVELQYALSQPCADRYGVWFVSESGESAPVPLVNAVGPNTARVMTPTGGALWLVLESTQVENTPGWGVPRTGCNIAIDEVRAAP
jgi:hypothetical protein